MKSQNVDSKKAKNKKKKKYYGSRPRGDYKSNLFHARFASKCGFDNTPVQVGDLVGYVSGQLRCESCWRAV